MCPVIKPNGKVRVTVHFKQLNKNVKRPNLMLHNLEDIATHLVGSQWFLARCGFLILSAAHHTGKYSFDEKNFYYTVWKEPLQPVPMGINLGLEQFQHKMSEV